LAVPRSIPKSFENIGVHFPFRLIYNGLGLISIFFTERAMPTLNKNQLFAATHDGGPMMVLAGPGSGKTTVIIHRIGHLVANKLAKPEEILVITFTKAAAEEMRVRYFDLSGGELAAISTFHSLFYRVVAKRYGYTVDNVLQEGERAAALKNILLSSGLSPDDDFTREISSELSLIKNEMLDIKFYNSCAAGADDFKNVYGAYEAYKKKNKKIDFDDMTAECLSLFENEKPLLKSWRVKFKYVLIDEFQDINKAQYECIKLLVRGGNIFVVGDDDQSIYRFRGARPEFILNFENDYPGVKKVYLDVNYRSTDKIINLCNNIIARNGAR